MINELVCVCVCVCVCMCRRESMIEREFSINWKKLHSFMFSYKMTSLFLKEKVIAMKSLMIIFLIFKRKFRMNIVTPQNWNTEYISNISLKWYLWCKISNASVHFNLERYILSYTHFTLCKKNIFLFLGEKAVIITQEYPCTFSSSC